MFSEYIEIIASFIDGYRPVLETLKSLSAISIIIASIRFLWGQFYYIRVNLSCGSFKVRKKDMTWQKLTPLVSSLFFNGDRVSPEVRSEILGITGLPVKEVCKKNLDIRTEDYVKVSLSCGSFEIRKRDMSWEKLISIVSLLFFNGETIPPDIKTEILEFTKLPVRNVKYVALEKGDSIGEDSCKL